MDMVRMAALFHFLLNSKSLHGLRAIFTQIHLSEKFTKFHFLVLWLEVPHKKIGDLQQDHLHMTIENPHV